ncbi:MAG TPA: bifunctional riboflavin kinase/FAD synthetase [Microbacteriaceae bacterium]|nr:bifunctional riboflavin kinase/FAD synthetase [Microbacteriaceae bacterium]
MTETSSVKYSVVAIGKFEGVHRGHQKILQRLNSVAKKNSYKAIVLTFENNPLSVLKPEACPLPLMSPKQRQEALIDRGVQEVFMIPFTKDLASQTPEEFVQTYLVNKLHAKHVIVGDDFRFGSEASGDSKTLEAIGKEHNFTVEVIAEVTDAEAGRVSSTLIREELAKGNVAFAAQLLGHLHSVRGVVVQGDASGRELGFPTANLGPKTGAKTLEGMVPADGVYAGYALVGENSYPAAISVGNNPTFTPTGQSRVEAYLLDFSGDLYGQTIEVLFADYIRPTLTFNSVEDLITQMHADVESCRVALSL